MGYGFLWLVGGVCLLVCLCGWKGGGKWGIGWTDGSFEMIGCLDIFFLFNFCKSIVIKKTTTTSMVSFAALPPDPNAATEGRDIT